MGLSKARKLLLVLVITLYVFSGTAHAWSWSWGSDQSGSNWGWGWSSDDSGSGSGSSDSNSGGGSSWGYGWSSNGTDTNWGWGSSSGSNHSSGTGSTHNNHTAPSNHSSGTGSTRNIHHNHTAPTNHSSGSIGSLHNHTAPVSHRRKIEVTVWKNGFNYQEWASKHAPFYTNDVLVFKYNNKNVKTQSKTKHSDKNDVYLLPDSRSYKRCDVSRGKKLAARGGSSLGFKLLLHKTQTYYLASGDHSGCNHHMKFSLSPIPRSSSHTKP